MLANGITLEVKEEGDTSYNELAGLKEVPELGMSPEKVDNTTLADKIKITELGIGDPGDLTYTFKWDNIEAGNSYRKLRQIADSGKKAAYQQTFPDGTKFQFDAQSSLKVGGGGVNAAIDYTLSLGLQSDITVIDPV